MPYIGLSLIIAILCAVHCLRKGRHPMWILVVLIAPFLGSLFYVIFEILPEYSGRREVRAVKAAAVRKLDPERDLRAAREALEVADTAANHSLMGDALGAAGKWSEAVVHYRAALAKMPGSDRASQLKLGSALLEAGDSEAARIILEALPESASQTESDRGRLLLARALQECGETDRAIALYAEIAPRMAGAEAQCRQAALLIEKGRGADAIPLLEDAQRKAARLDRFERARDGEMYDWAARTLRELKGG
jgi:hypothetical protein